MLKSTGFFRAMKFFGIIPSRYASTRFPAKPLADIGGTSMVMRVFRQAQKSGLFSGIYVATDDARIFDHVQEHNGVAVMTSQSHQSGTDRCAEVAASLLQQGVASADDVIVNIQGDEPFIQPGQIKKITELFRSQSISIATLIKKVDFEEELFDENVVKAVPGAENRIVYFSRFPVPFLRGVPRNQWLQNGRWFKHIGMYAYRLEVLLKISGMEQVEAEKAESLEQLRWLANGVHVHYAETSQESISVDRPEDLLKLINKA